MVLRNWTLSKFVERMQLGMENHHHFESNHASFHYEAIIGLPAATPFMDTLLSWFRSTSQQRTLR